MPPRGGRSFGALAVSLVLLTAWPVAGQPSGTIEGTVYDLETVTPLAGATVLLVEAQRQLTTGGDGRYRLRAPAGEYTILATAVGHQTLEQRITLEARETVAMDFHLGRILAAFGEELVVLGSRSQRIALETPVPVDVLSAEAIGSTGMSETSRAVEALAPSFNVSTSTISDGTDIVRPATLRGLGPDDTLVLVNGKRRHPSALVHVNGSIGRGTAGVDLNAIPSSAVDRIEVLRAGAAAQYGSDAIAGVLNLRLRGRTDRTRVMLYAGQHYAGDGEVGQASVNHGLSVGERGYFNFTAEVRNRNFTNRAGLDPRRIFNYLEQELFEPELESGTPDPRERTYDRLNHRYGDAESDNLYLFVNSSLPLGDDAEVYFFGGYSQRDGRSAGFNRLPRQSRTNVFVHPEGHLPFIDTDVDDLSFSLGLRKNWARWLLDASATAGENEFLFTITNSANTSLGPESPDRAVAGGPKFGQLTLGVDLYGTLRSNVNLAVGAEYREDRYEIVAGEAASWVDGGFPDQFGGRAPAGIQVFPGFRPSGAVDERRDNLALYGDLELPRGDRLLIGLAARFEEYSDFGSTLTGKLALRYELNDRMAVRGAASTGFRAPSLHQSHFNNISTQFVDVDGALTPLEVGTFRVGSPVARALGAAPLVEETSTSLSLGLVARPGRTLALSLDLFSVDIDDRIVLSGRFEASNPRIGPLLEPFRVNAAQFFTNAIDTETVGGDVVLAWSRPLGRASTLAVTGAANWNETDVVSVDTPVELEGLDETLFPFIDRTYVELAQPRESYLLSARYGVGDLSLVGGLRKIGAVSSTESNTDPEAFQTFSGKWLADLDLAYTVGRVTVSVGGRNLFDTFPDENIPRNSFNGIFVYPRRTAPFGFNGGFYYLRLILEL